MDGNQIKRHSHPQNICEEIEHESGHHEHDPIGAVERSVCQPIPFCVEPRDARIDGLSSHGWVHGFLHEEGSMVPTEVIELR